MNYDEVQQATEVALAQGVPLCDVVAAILALCPYPPSSGSSSEETAPVSATVPAGVQ